MILNRARVVLIMKVHSQGSRTRSLHWVSRYFAKSTNKRPRATEFLNLKAYCLILCSSSTLVIVVSLKESKVEDDVNQDDIPPAKLHCQMRRNVSVNLLCY